MRMRNEPLGASMVRSPTPATSAGGAIKAMRASYCARATSTGRVCVAGTPVPLSSNAWICASTGIACPDPAGLLRGARECRGAGRKKAIEHLPRALVEHNGAAGHEVVNLGHNMFHTERMICIALLGLVPIMLSPMGQCMIRQGWADGSQRR